MRVPARAVSSSSGIGQPAMVEHQQRALAPRLELEPEDALRLAGVRPVVLEQAGRVELADDALGDLLAGVVEADDDPAADPQVDLHLAEPATQLLRLGERRPEL